MISGGIAERAKFHPQLIATAVLIGFICPLFEGIACNQRFDIQAWLKAMFSGEFHDFAGLVVVHAVGIFGQQSLGGIDGVSIMSQLMGPLLGMTIAAAGGVFIYGVLKSLVGIRLDPEQEFDGADLSVHKISSTVERETNW